MKSASHRSITFLALVAALAFTAGLLLQLPEATATQDGGGWSPPAAGNEHQTLARMAGEWTSTTHIYGQESEGIERNRILSGGLWVLSHFEGHMMGTTFEGIGLHGYDPHKKKFINVWVDSTSPSLSVSEGQYDAESDSLVFLSDMTDPGSGQTMKMKIVEKFVSENQRQMTMSMGGEAAGGKPMMTIDYTRKASE